MLPVGDSGRVFNNQRLVERMVRQSWMSLAARKTIESPTCILPFVLFIVWSCNYYVNGLFSR